ncbi:unnamed protein product, partial [Schistosoma mattheei]
KLTDLQRALLLAYAETENNVTGSVEGVTSTDKRELCDLDYTSLCYAYGKRAIDTTPGFILSRIRLAIQDPNEPQEEAKSQEIDSDTVVKNSSKDCV